MPRIGYYAGTIVYKMSIPQNLLEVLLVQVTSLSQRPIYLHYFIVYIFLSAFEPTDSGDVLDRPEYKKIHNEYRNLVSAHLGVFLLTHFFFIDI